MRTKYCYPVIMEKDGDGYTKEGNGIDSNGSIVINGGEIYMEGCADGPDSALMTQGDLGSSGGKYI